MEKSSASRCSSKGTPQASTKMATVTREESAKRDSNDFLSNSSYLPVYSTVSESASVNGCMCQGFSGIFTNCDFVKYENVTAKATKATKATNPTFCRRLIVHLRPTCT